MNFMHFSLSFVHVGHGILSYYIFHFLDGEEEPFFFLKKNRFNLRDNFDRMIRPVKSGLGLITALFFALAFEIIENSPIIISLFRQNTGKSKIYSRYFLFTFAICKVQTHLKKTTSGTHIPSLSTILSHLSTILSVWYSLLLFRNICRISGWQYDQCSRRFNLMLCRLQLCPVFESVGLFHNSLNCLCPFRIPNGTDH